MKRGVTIAVAAACVLASAALAQTVVLPGTGGTSLAQERQALIAANRQAREARDRSVQLQQQAESATRDADRARQNAAALAAKIQASEAEIQAAQARIAIVARLQSVQAARLAERQQPIVRLTAALQMLARRPAALALVQPGSISDAVHMRMVLGSVLPVIRQRTAGLREELERSRQLRMAAEQSAGSLRDSRARLATQQADLRKLETAKRLASRDFRSVASVEADRAVALGERARDIVDLMGELEAAGAVRARLETLPGPSLRPYQPSAAGAPAPEHVAAQAGPPPYRLPAIGALVTGLGEISDSGARSRGLTIATQPGAQVIAPTAGRVAFADHYRGYGDIVIIDHGQGWTSLITGMERLSVDVGAQVAQGDPLGVTGAGAPKVTVELRRNGRPVDIVPLIGAR
jgi:septal ring factor EnvC (AmiA/AmiB activator)